ncbi:MAG TPA: methyl-accepting chemotaxis protein, partial [Magnetococcales bacterium]|nr:methyl-accepting chemotaxis protein [Magnetococcales bacterium]
FHSIRSQMILGFVILFIPIVLLLEFVSISGIPMTEWHGFQGIEIEQGFRYLDLIADTKKERLLRWLEERKGDARIIAHTPLLIHNLPQLRAEHAREHSFPDSDPVPGPARDRSAPFREVLEMLRLVQRTYAIYQEIKIADPRDGTLLITTSDQDIQDRTDHEWLKTTPRLKEAVSVYLTWDASHANALLHFVHPIISEEGQAVALVVLTANPESLFGPLMHTGDGLGEQGEAFLFDKNLAILTRLKHPLPDGSTARPLHYRLQTAPALLAVSGKEGTMDSLDYRGRPVLAAYRHLPFVQDQEWGFVVQMDREEMLGFLNYEIRIVLIISTIALLLLFTLSWWMSARLSRPIIRLSQVAERFSQGDMEVRSRLHERNEIGLLSHTFDRMADTVQRTMGHLAEQTQQLN